MFTPFRHGLIAVISLVYLLGFVAGCNSRHERSDRVRLLLTTAAIEPGSSFEIVFDDPVVRFDDIGTTNANPLVIRPHLPGTFVWRSRRGGLFRPAEPMQLGTRYLFSLHPGLTNSAGDKIRADLVRYFSTPSLELSVRREGWWDDHDAPTLPTLIASLNARVDAANLAEKASFVAGSLRIRAVVEPIGSPRDDATSGLAWPGAPRRADPTWEERFPGWTNLPAHPPGRGTRAASFVVRPERALESTNEWHLEFAAGLNSAESAVRLRAPIQVPIGRVMPFEVSSVEAANQVAGGRQIRLRFSQAVASELTNQAVASWFQCRPTVSDLAVERSPGGRTLAISGSFALEQNYEIRIKAGLAGGDAVQLKTDFIRTLQFQPIRANAWLSEFDTIQLAAGQRRFELLAVNTPEVRLRLKALDSHGLIPTLRAYERYLRDRRPQQPDVVAGAALDYAGIPGRTVLDVSLDTAGPVDEAVRIERSWNDLVPQTGDVPARPVGAYFVEAILHHVPADETGAENRIGPQAIVQVTDLGFVGKPGEEATTVWVFSHETGKSLPGVTVSLRSDENAILTTGVTDGSGLVRLPKFKGAAWILVQREGDQHAQRLDVGEVSTWRFDLESDPRDTTALRLFAFSDRAAYRPGETLHLKVLARHWRRGEWELPTNSTVALQLNGPRGDTVLRTNLPLSASGSGDWTWISPAGVRGGYRAILSCGEGTLTHSFEVRDFQSAAFEVSVGSRPAYGPGESASVVVTARYLFGQPLARAKVQWQARAWDQSFAPAGWEAFRFTGSVDDWRFSEEETSRGEAVRQEVAALTNGATASLALDLPFNPRQPQPQSVEFLAEVTDLNQQTISRQVQFVRHPSDYYLGFRWTQGEEALLTTNRPLAFQLVAVGYDGVALTNAVEVHARLRRVEWKSVAVLQAGHVVGRRSEAEYHGVSEGTFPTQPVVQMGARWEVAVGTNNSHVLPPLADPGAYVLELRGSDRGGRGVLTTIHFAVTGDGHLVWHQRNGAQLELVPDRERHHPGDVATLLVKAPFPGTALVTVEREDVLRSFTTELRGNAPAITVPLRAGDGPNVLVGVTLVRGSGGNPHSFPMPEWRVGYQNLPVIAVEDSLRVVVNPADPVRAPGEAVSIRATVRDSADQVVSGAEVTLYAVDEGFLLLTGTTVPDPGANFAAPRPLGVSTILSLPSLLPEDPELRRFENKGFLAGGGGRLGDQRRNFVPCPYWNAALKTDSHGEVSVTFPAPDSLTRYRVVAVATRGARAMGAGAASFEVKKNLMIEPALPRFAHVGDQLAARALVFNQSSRPLAVIASLSPGTNAVLAKGHTGKVRVDVSAGGIQVVEFPVNFTTPGTDLWQWRAEADGWVDGVAAPLPVTWAEPAIREVRQLRLGEGSTNLLAEADPAVLELPESVTVRLALHPLAFVGEGVEQLLHYPYGCVEQTGSSLLPWLALREFSGLLPVERRDPTNFNATVQSGVQRFWSMQTQSGGLAYWPGGGAPQRWGSAYAAWILALAQSAGADVDEDRLERLRHWLNAQWRQESSPGEAALAERCLTALALAEGGVPEPTLHEALMREKERLGSESRAWLALAHLKSGGDPAVARSLLQLPAGRNEAASMGLFGSAARVKAIRLLAYTALDPTGAETLAALTELLGAGQGGHWQTTQGNAWALWAMAEQVRQSADRKAGTASLGLGGDTRPVLLDAARPIVTETFAMTAVSGSSGLLCALSGPGPWYAEVAVSGRRPGGTNAVAAIDRGFAIQRTYARLDDQNRPLSSAEFTVGDRVLVTLDLTVPEAAEWVAMEDPLPSNFEAVQGAFVTETTAASSLLPSWTSDFREVRLDRTFIFRDELPEGRHRIQYLARVRAAGNAVAAPAKIEAMYQPQRHGFSAGSRVQSVSAP